MQRGLPRNEFYSAKRRAEVGSFANVEKNGEVIFRIAKQMKRENQDVVGDFHCPTDIVAKMLKASVEVSCPLLCDIANAIIAEGVIPGDWNMSYIINLYKGKGDALERGSYRWLKLTEHCFKVIERVIEKITRTVVEIDEMQFGFVPGKGLNDAIFILCQLQEKHLEKSKTLYLAFVDLKKAFDRVPHEVLWWAMRRKVVQEWLVYTVKAMYSEARSRVRINNSFIDSFEVQVGVHQGSI